MAKLPQLRAVELLKIIKKDLGISREEFEELV